MDFNKLTSSKRQTKLSQKAQASVKQGTDARMNTKHKNPIIADDSPIPAKKGRALTGTQPSDGLPSNRATNQHPLATTVTSSLGLMGDETPHANVLSDHNAMLTWEIGSGAVRNPVFVEDDDVEMREVVAAAAVKEARPKETPQAQLGMQCFTHLGNY